MKTWLMRPWKALWKSMAAVRRPLIRKFDNHIRHQISAALDGPSQELTAAVRQAMAQHREALEEINLFNESIVREVVRMQNQLEHVQSAIADLSDSGAQNQPAILSVFKDLDAA